MYYAAEVKIITCQTMEMKIKIPCNVVGTLNIMRTHDSEKLEILQLMCGLQYTCSSVGLAI